MWSEKKLNNYTSWLVFFIALIVYYLSVERTGSLWDCGEFILGAYKLQVVHPPGAPLFVLIGSIFAHLGDAVSDNPAHIAFGVNLMSGLFSALTALLVAKTTMILGHKMLIKTEEPADQAQKIVINGAGLVAGLVTAFSTSIWFSAVEGEVYAMSTFFTALTVWAAFKWYSLPDTRDADRWLLFAIFSGGLSVGVHLLSILAFPVLTLLYYYKKYKKHTYLGILASLAIGALMMLFTLKFIIAGIPWVWTKFELMMVNGLGAPFHTGLIPTILLVVAIVYFALRYAERTRNYVLHLVTIGAMLVTIAFSLIGVVVIRANADTPVNMNVPSDAFRLLPYLNREQYGERALLYGPYFDAKPVDYDYEERYGQVGDRYEIVDEKISPTYNSADKMMFPRLGSSDQGRPALYRAWLNKRSGKPSQLDNFRFFIQYQVGWMYWRYFMWNFAGRQNGDQGFFDSDVSSGNWESGIKFLDEARLHNMDEMPDTLKNDAARNHYYLIPFILGLLGMYFHAKKRKKDFFALFSLFVITGLGIIVYSNQPPNEPRERDYVLVGSFFTFAMWIGLAIPALYELLKDKIKIGGTVLAGLSLALVLVAPLLMGFQNFDDHSRKDHYGSRDYASNFLNSCEEDAIIFTYGDNDTYPLWYAQEVEGIRRDVRVVNLSLIAVDWYINKLRNKVNESDPIKLTISEKAIRGNKRNHLLFPTAWQRDPKPQRSLELTSALKFMGEDHRPPIQGRSDFDSYIPSQKLHITVDKPRAIRSGWVSEKDSSNMVDKINISFNKNYLTKDEIAVLDIIASNIYDRPIYFAVTSKNEKLMGLNDYMQLEGLGLRIVPVKTKSNKSMQIFGSGRTDALKIYDNVMDKWRWGNFDKEDTHINTSYGAEINAMKMAMNRAARDLVIMGEKDKAVALSKKYFEAFPHFNFPYDYSIMPFVEVLIEGEEYEDAKKQMRILAEESWQFMNFFLTLSDNDLSSFEKHVQIAQVSINGILRNAGKVKDDAFRDEMNAMLGDFDYSSIMD